MTVKPVYLDYAATTPVSDEVFEAMAGCMTFSGDFGNPASRSHVYGWRAEQLVEQARKKVAELVSCDVREIVWTSGATEADNLAIKGVAEADTSGKRHIVCSAIEHKAVLDTCGHLEKQGFRVTRVKPDASGVVTADAVLDALCDDTLIVSVMHVNNETGMINDVAEIGRRLKDRKVWFHVDAAQSAGKLPIDLSAWHVHLMSFSAHKIYGPKGVGALYVQREGGPQVAPQMHGGGHERGMRSGTLPVHQLVGMGKAFELAQQSRERDFEHLSILKSRFLDIVLAEKGIGVNGDVSMQFPGIVNLYFDGVEGESMMMALSNAAVSSGSACTSASVEPSFVLRAMGVNDVRAHSSLRFSFGRPTTMDEVEQVAGTILDSYRRLRT